MHDFNFFSGYLEKKSTTSKFSHSMIAVTAIIVTGMIGYGAYNAYHINDLKSQIGEQEAFLNAGSTIEKAKEIQIKKQQYELMNKYYSKADMINKSLIRQNVINSKLLEDIASTLPMELFIKNITLQEKEIQLQGVSSSRVAIAELEYNLKALGIFEKVHVNLISIEGEDSSNFTYAMKCTLKDVSTYEND